MVDQESQSDTRDRLEAEQAHLREQLHELTPEHEASPDFDDNFADSGQVAAEQGENRVLASSLAEQLDEVNAALHRLDAGTYGQCVVCGEAIAAERLEAMPATPHCIRHA